MTSLRVILIKPSKYTSDGFVERFRWGFMPNSTLAHIRGLTPAAIGDVRCDVVAIDEYVQTDLAYLSLLQGSKDSRTLLALVGVQSHQFHRALDLAAWARERGVEHCIIGGPHPMTCDTEALQTRGVSFALAEAEIVWTAVLRDAIAGELGPVYGRNQRWEQNLDPPVLSPPLSRDLRRYAIPMLGIYPARGCPYTCNFCSVIKIAGRMVRSQPVTTTVASLHAAKAAGVRLIMFTSDNFNKYPDAKELLRAMIEENIRLPFFVQCDTQIYRQEELIELLARAGCFQMFVGVESFSRDALRDAHKYQNHPEHYAEIVSMCIKYGITTHFSNIIGFPTDTEQSILEHLDILTSLRPDLASFYILTPIPGTEQYDEFLDAGFILEENLDRFDGTAVTWRHPHLSASRIKYLLEHCHREFFAIGNVASKIFRAATCSLDFRTLARFYTVIGYPFLSRLAVRSHNHPMAGGTIRVHLDRAQDYAASRYRIFHLTHAPLPRSLPLSEADQLLNRHAKLAI